MNVPIQTVEVCHQRKIELLFAVACVRPSEPKVHFVRISLS